MLRDLRWDLVVVDEAHYLSETSASGRVYRTERSRFGRFISERTDSLVLVDGNTAQRRPSELVQLDRSLDPTLLASPDELNE